MSRVVAPGATQRDVIDAINAQAGKVAVGEVALEAGTVTTVINPSIGVRSLVLFVPAAGGGAFGGAGGDGGVQLVHPSNSQGQVYHYVVFNR